MVHTHLHTCTEVLLKQLLVEALITTVEILKIVNEAGYDTSSTTGSSSVKQLHETTDLWSLNPQGHYATVDTVPDDIISRTDTSKGSEGMSLGKLFGKATLASADDGTADDGTASADFLVKVGHAISVLITSPQSTITKTKRERTGKDK
ncbi:unnamed protein product [Sphagnum jensenii]|uniref:Uncharacterized protein n=1 Tax=Sphagnum jensenii TaxID=128206 RepID=A0ABP0XEH1_9BRYO